MSSESHWLKLFIQCSIPPPMAAQIKYEDIVLFYHKKEIFAIKISYFLQFFTDGKASVVILADIDPCRISLLLPRLLFLTNKGAYGIIIL